MSRLLTPNFGRAATHQLFEPKWAKGFVAIVHPFEGQLAGIDFTVRHQPSDVGPVNRQDCLYFWICGRTEIQVICAVHGNGEVL